jgi:ribosomal protein S18 acetylase RimI-like enzyme
MRNPSPELLGIVRWQDLSSAQQASVRRLKITDAQVEFSGSIEKAIAACESDQAGHIVGLALCYRENVVGFLLVKQSTAAPDWTPPGAAIISALRIDQAHQGRGFGTTALQVLPDWIAQHWSHINALVLSVDEGNTAGIRAYQKAGFHDLGQRVPGRIGYVRYMFRALKPESD